ncbi:MAG TPA: PhzF family phenazine biosynthesis protein [Polyangia bacterium]|nr:PhzF family phenazine biosynthesis protein [Polyangia bacterium]
MREIDYELCDVFTDRPLAGNALAVFTDADEIDGATMQALARETNLSESAFVLRASHAGADAAIRIFTPTMELPFAGHPTLGTAFVLSARDQRNVIKLETGRGVVTVSLSREDGRPGFGWMTQPLPRIEPYREAPALMTALGVSGSNLPVDLYDNGPQYVYVGLERPEDVAALTPDLTRLAALGSTGFSVFARNGSTWKCRVFAPGEGIPEDPATGAAAGPLAVHLARYGRIAFGDEIVIAQGIEIGRPSTLHARIRGTRDRLDSVEVGGHAVIVGHGTFRLS